MKYILLLLGLLWGISIQAQQTGNFEKSISFKAKTKILAYYVPENYDINKNYPLIIAIHGCGGSGKDFRNSLVNLSKEIDAFILCPDFEGGQLEGDNGMLIPQAITYTIKDLNYHIDTTAIYLTGFSCNGQETFKQGWKSVYPFRGIIPFNAWIPSVDALYNFESKIPTCICTGDRDPSHTNNLILFDSLEANNGVGKLNIMPGIGHLWMFSTRDAELKECLNWINAVYDSSIVSLTGIKHLVHNTRVFPNPASESIQIEINYYSNQPFNIYIYDLNGNAVESTIISNKHSSISVNHLPVGIYSLQITQHKKQIDTYKFAIQR